jgi:hypothetical protein
VTARYKVHGTWSTTSEITVRDADWDRKGTVITETADAIDTRTGRVYLGGAFRVRAKAKIKGLPRGRTFIGETAWSLAESLHRDMVSALHFADLPN